MRFNIRLFSWKMVIGKTLILNWIWGCMEELVVNIFWPVNNISIVQMTKSNIKFHRLEHGPKSVAYCFSDVETEIKSKLYVPWFKLLSVILCRSKLFATLSPIRASHFTGHHYSLRTNWKIRPIFKRHCIIFPHPALGDIKFRSQQTYLLCDMLHPLDIHLN